MNFPPQKSPCGGAGGRLSPAAALAAGEGLGEASQAGRCETAAMPPAKGSRAKCRRVCLEVTTSIADGRSPALFLSQDCSVPIRTPLSPTGCNLWLQQPDVRAVPAQPIAAARCSIAAAAAVGAGWGSQRAHAPHCYPVAAPRVSPWPKVPALPQKAKAALSKSRPASPCAPEACSGGRNPNK